MSLLRRVVLLAAFAGLAAGPAAGQNPQPNPASPPSGLTEPQEKPLSSASLDLLQAAMMNDAPGVAAALKAGADVNAAAAASHMSALAMAALNGNVDIVNTLLAAGAEVNVEDKTGS